MNLSEKMTQGPARERVVQDCVGLVDEEVKSKGGLGGVAVKGAYAVVKAVKPRFVHEVIDAMLDEWVAKLEPFYTEWQGKPSGSLSDFVAAKRSEVADRLLEVTDARAGRAKNVAVKKMYEKMRPTAKKHVEAAVPRLGRLVERHASA